MSGEDNTVEVLEGVGGPNGDGVLVMGPDSPLKSESGDKDGAAADDSSDQDSSYVQVDRVETSNDSVHTDSDDMKTTDDAGKDDMFVDAPDELGASAQATDSEETAERSIEETTRFYEEGGMQSYQLVGEVEHLRSTLEKVIAENNALYREKQEERLSSMRDIADIRRHIKAFTNRRPLAAEHDERSIDGLKKDEPEEEVTSDKEIQLSQYVRESSESLKRALEGSLQKEEEIRELHEKLDSKDREISDLKAINSQLSQSQESQEELLQVQNQSYLSVDSVMTQLLNTLSTVVHQAELDNDSISTKASMVESSLSLLIQNYTQVVYDIEQLQQSLNPSADAGKEDYRTIISAARDELLELKTKVDELTGLLHMEKEAAAKLKTELDQEKAKSGNLREKLSLAVTKGKGLVQQRDSLRQSLAEKTRELEDSLGKLQDTSHALKASEHRIVELVACESMLTSLQESLSLKDETLGNVEEMLSLANLPESIQFQNFPEKVKWLVDDRSVLAKDSMELQRIEDVMSSFDFPETVSSLDVVSRIGWLKESYHLANSDIIKLQDELARMKEAEDNEIYRLTTSLSDIVQEKEYMKTELTDLSEKFDGIVQKDRLLLEEKEDAMKMLLVASGIPYNKEELIDSSTNLSMLIEKYLSRTVEQRSLSSESSLAQTEDFERKITTLYVKDMELTLCLQLLEEDDSELTKFRKQLDELKLASEKYAELKDERDSLQKDLSRAEDKVSTLRDKLSMAVKKGKGLVQERENMKGNLDEKNQEIEKLKHEIQQLEFQMSDYTDKITNMSIDLKGIPSLEAEIVSIKGERDQFQKFLEEKEYKLRVIFESVQTITLPTDVVFEDPCKKLEVIDSYINESEAYKLDSEKALEKMKHEVSDFELKLAEAHSLIKSREDRVFDVDNKLSQVTSEKNELETHKALLEQELQKLKEEAQDQSIKLSLEKDAANAGKLAVEMELEKAQEELATQTSNLTEAFTTIRTLEDKLSQMEANISLLTEQNDVRQQEGRSVLEIEVQKLKDEISSQAEELVNTHSTIKMLQDAASKTEEETKIANGESLALSSKLEEAYETIKAQENTISDLEVRVSTLTEENSKGQTMRSSLMDEIHNLQEKINSLEASLADACTTVTSLEDAASDAKTTMSVLVGEKMTAEALVSELQTKLNACLEEMSGTHGNSQSRYMKLISHLKNLHMLTKNDMLAPLRRKFQRPLENLKSMDLVLVDIGNHFEVIGGAQPSLWNSETDTSISEFLTDILTIDSCGNTSEEIDDVDKLVVELADRLHSKDRYISDKIEGFCTILDTFTEVVLHKLQLSKSEILGLVDHVESLKRSIEELEFGIQERDETITTLEKDLNVISSVSAEAETQLVNLCSTLEVEFTSDYVIPEVISEFKTADMTLGDKKYAEIANSLSVATRMVHSLIMKLVNSKKVMTTTLNDLQNDLALAESSLEEHRKENNQNQSSVSKLEADLQASQCLCDQLSLEIENHQANREILMKKEAEVSLLYNNLLSKEQGIKDSHISTSLLRELLNQVNGVDFPVEEAEDLSPHGPTLVKKLGFIIDKFSEMQIQLALLLKDKEELQSTIGQQKTEIRHLQEEILEHSKVNQVSQPVKNEFSEFALHLEKVILKLGGTEASEDQTPEDVKRLLSVVDKLIGNLVLEYGNSKSEVRQLSAKLIEGQKVVDSLSMKVQSLEELIQNQRAIPQMIQERDFVAPSTSAASEITEVEDADLSGKSTITPVSSAAQMRTFRKGSTEHLAINIDSESAPLISNVGTDEDKGHVFKSLNTTGLVPKQGKLIADRIDGYWVNGGRILMNQPRARLGVMTYWLVLHLWLLASIL